MASAPDSLLLLAVNDAQEKQCRNDSEGIKERGYAFLGTPACAGFFIDFATYKTNHENRYDQNQQEEKPNETVQIARPARTPGCGAIDNGCSQQ
jgi:hypothetical protein